jgi:hypothetical protein
MDVESVSKWLDAYVAAWRSYDRRAIADLFSEDVTYRYHPYDRPESGRDRVVDAWLEDPDARDSWDASYEPVAIDGDIAVAKGVTRYHAREGRRERVYHNVFLITFDDAGRCRDFVEYYMKAPAKAANR